MAATIRISYYGASASEPAGVNAESAHAWNRSDTLTGGNSIPKPGATGTAFSFVKQLATEVTVTGATTIGTFRVKMDSTPTSGITLGFLGHASYVSQVGGTAAGSDSGSNGAVPTGYAALTTSFQTYDSQTGVSTASSGRKGNFCRIAAGIDNTFSGGGGATATPNITFEYTEQ